MKHRSLILLCLFFFAGCQHREKETTNDIDEVANVPPAPVRPDIQEVEPFKEFSKFWDYYARRIKLNEDFLGYDVDGKPMSKRLFLEDLSTGNYQPILINPADSIRYQLKPHAAGAEDAIGQYMKMFGEKELIFYGMEKNPVPRFSFETLEGNKYTSENTKGKIVLFKCWFIACVPCVQEMPELNGLVEYYQDRKDILFVSLAIDDPAPLKKFLDKTKFDYQTVAGQKTYMSDKLNVDAYPTHFLIDKEGKVVKVSDSADETATFLRRLLDREDQEG